MGTVFLVNGTLSNGTVFGSLFPEFFHMTATCPGGIPLHRHVDFLAFSAPLMDCSCRKLAHSAQTVRREQSLCSKNLRKFLQMPVRWYPSRASGGHVENSFVFANDTGLKCISMHVSSVWYTFQQKARQQSRTANLHK